MISLVVQDVKDTIRLDKDLVNLGHVYLCVLEQEYLAAFHPAAISSTIYLVPLWHRDLDLGDSSLVIRTRQLL